MSEISYKTIGGRNFMLIPCTETGKNIETQIRMLTSGEMGSVMPVTPTSKNGAAILQYDITGLTRLSGVTQYGKLNRAQLAALIEGLLAVVEECSSYALSASGISLDSDCVYLDAKYNTAKFAYVPTLRDGEPVEACREMLRSLIAYGKVEHDPLTASLTDAINSPSFSLLSLKEVVRQSRGGVQAPEQPRRPEPQPVSAAMPVRQDAPQAVPVNAAVAVAEPPVIAPVRQPAAPVPMPETPSSQTAKAGKSKKGNVKNTLIIAVTAVVSLAAVVGTCFTPVVLLPEGGLDVTKVLGVALLIGALDFLLLRNRLSKAGTEPSPANITENKGKKKQEKKPAAKQAPASSPLPFAPPLAQSAQNFQPQPQAQPVSPAPQAPPVFTPQPVPVQPVSRAPQPAYPESGGDETVVFDEPAATGMLYLQTAGGEIISLTKSPFLIGRDSAVSDYTLNDGTVGRKHAEFISRDGGWDIIDQNSRNHTYLNETCLNPYTPYPVSVGDTVRLAGVALQVKSR